MSLVVAVAAAVERQQRGVVVPGRTVEVKDSQHDGGIVPDREVLQRLKDHVLDLVRQGRDGGLRPYDQVAVGMGLGHRQIAVDGR